MSGWRVWQAFECRPGITMISQHDWSRTRVALAEACQGSDGKIDVTEFDRWMMVMIEYGHLLALA